MMQKMKDWASLIDKVVPSLTLMRCASPENRHKLMHVNTWLRPWQRLLCSRLIAGATTCAAMAEPSIAFSDDPLLTTSQLCALHLSLLAHTYQVQKWRSWPEGLNDQQHHLRPASLSSKRQIGRRSSQYRAPATFPPQDYPRRAQTGVTARYAPKELRASCRPTPTGKQPASHHRHAAQLLQQWHVAKRPRPLFSVPPSEVDTLEGNGNASLFSSKRPGFAGLDQE